MPRPEPPVNALDRGLQVLEAFGRRGFSLSLAGLAAELKLPKPTLHRLLSTLMARGYVLQSVKGGAYCLGPAVLDLGFAMLDGLEVREAALPFLEALFQEVEANVNLSVLEPGGLEVMYVARLRRQEVLSLNLNVGSRLPSYSSSPGRVLLANLPGPQRRQALAGILADPQAAAWLEGRRVDLAAVLDQVAEQGYAVNDGEYLPELFAMAAPVWDQERRAVAAVSVALLKRRQEGRLLEERLLGPLLACTRGLSALLGHRPRRARASPA
ncbi:MAG: IclR family transcriptional regulator [Desulfarculus sp.]|nr:IclR family transcriptional regulator [Desulfarculus sp.]